MAELNLCGDAGVIIPDTEVCDECEIFEQRLQEVEAFADNAESQLNYLNTCCSEVQSDVTSLQTQDEYLQLSIDQTNNAIEDVSSRLDNKQNKLVAGVNIEIDGDVISAVNSDPLEFFYPVGSIYMSVNNADPALLFGGSWTQIKDRFLLSAGDTYSAGATGGEATHLLLANESGNQKHSVNTNTVQQSHHHDTGSSASTAGYMVVQGNSTGLSEARVAHASSGDRVVPAQAYNTTVDYAKLSYTGYTALGHNHSVDIPAKDATKAHNNMPPYLVVYMWVRTE